MRNWRIASFLPAGRMCLQERNAYLSSRKLAFALTDDPFAPVEHLTAPKNSHHPRSTRHPTRHARRRVRPLRFSPAAHPPRQSKPRHGPQAQEVRTCAHYTAAIVPLNGGRVTDRATVELLSGRRAATRAKTGVCARARGVCARARGALARAHQPPRKALPD